jgi:hypothetical protein
MEQWSDPGSGIKHPGSVTLPTPTLLDKFFTPSFFLKTEEDEEEEEAEPIYQNQGQILIAQQQLDHQQQQLEPQQQHQQQQQLVPGQEPIYQNLPLHEKLNQSYTGEEEEEEQEYIPIGNIFFLASRFQESS